MRIATVSELPEIADLKLKMFQEVGMEQILMDGFIDEVINRYGQMYESRTACHFVIESHGQIVACAGAFIKDDMPYCFYREQKNMLLSEMCMSVQIIGVKGMHAT